MKLRIETQLLRELLWEDYEHDDWQVVEDKVTGTWRWGIYKTVILKRIVDGEETFWGFDYQVETSHEDYRIMDLDESEVELWKATTVTVTEYKEEKNEN